MTDSPLAARYRQLRDDLGSDHPDTKKAFTERLTEVSVEEMLDPQPGLWWLSFCDPHRPKGDQFLGAAIVEAYGVMDAIATTHLLGVNPGGEIQTLGPIPPDLIAPGWRDRLLSKTEANLIAEDQDAAAAGPTGNGE